MAGASRDDCSDDLLGLDASWRAEADALRWQRSEVAAREPWSLRHVVLGGLLWVVAIVVIGLAASAPAPEASRPPPESTRTFTRPVVDEPPRPWGEPSDPARPWDERRVERRSRGW